MKQFACFQLDTQNECLWRNGDRIPLTPKPFAVLRYLVENPQRLVTHDELLEALWPETYVQPQVLRTYVLELRKVLGDDAGNARFIETVPKRGYRFISPVGEVSYVAGYDYERQPGSAQPTELLGRSSELKHLHQAMAAALQNERQVVFVTGEVGIGKTALVDGFCRHVSSDGQCRIARGQSVEGFGGKEPYYPVMEALIQLCNENGDAKSLRILQQKAPNWYSKLPCVITTEVRSTPPAGSSVPSERLLGELCDAIEAMATDKPLILVFEDLHWADHSSLDLISALARRRAPAKLLLIATYRPGDVSDAQHPLKGLKQDLLTRKLCVETAVLPLAKTAVREYLIRELGQTGIPEGLTSFLHQHSEGNPLFMIAMLEHLMTQDYLRKGTDALWQLTCPLAEIDMGVPTALSELIELQIDRLDLPEQRLLEAASLIGVVFPAWAAAAALNGELEEIEDQYEKLTRRLHFLHSAGHDELPDGTQSAFYVFTHGLYREVLYKRQSSSRRARRHLRVAERLLQLFAGREQDVASELAVHFEAAGDWIRAAEALMTSAKHHLRRGDQQEATMLLRQAGRLLENLPERERNTAANKIRQQISSLDSTAAEALTA
jgi:predicted ATPase